MPEISVPTVRAHELVVDSLTGLAEIRDSQGNWIDFERELAIESQAYKRLDALSCFLATNKYPKLWSYIEQETRSWLHHDLEIVLNFIEKDGFYPSPYGPPKTPDNQQDQYIDFACDTLDLCCDIVSSFPAKSSLFNLAEKCAIKAMETLITEGNFYQDTFGCAWAATTKFENQRGVTAYHSYFTSLFVIAVRRAIEDTQVKEWLGKKQCERAKLLAQQACHYILASTKDGTVLPTSDADPRNVAQFQKLIYSCWGLRAFLCCKGWIDVDQKKVKPLINGFLKLLGEQPVEEAFSHVAISANGFPGYYEYRHSIGGIITALAEINRNNIPVSQSKLRNMVHDFYKQLIECRDDNKKIWYKDSITVSSMPTVITDLLCFGEQFADLDKTLKMSIADLKSQVIKILEANNLLDKIADLVTSGLSEIADYHADIRNIHDTLRIHSNGPKKTQIKKPKRKERDNKL